MPEGIVPRRSSAADPPSTQTLDSQSARGKQTNRQRRRLFPTLGFDDSRSLFSLRWQLSKLPPPSRNSESLPLFSFLTLVLFRRSAPFAHMLHSALALWMFSSPGFELPGGKSANPSPAITHPHPATLIYYSAAVLFSSSTLSLLSPLFIPPLFFNPPSSYCSPPLFSFSLYFSLIFLSSSPVFFFLLPPQQFLLCIPDSLLRFPPLPRPLPSNVNSFERSHAFLLASVVSLLRDVRFRPPAAPTGGVLGRSEGLRLVRTLPEMIRVLPLSRHEEVELSA